MKKSADALADDMKQEKKTLAKRNKRISELDKLFTKVYEYNATRKLSDERFAMMSKSYDEEQKKLRVEAASLASFISTREQKIKVHAPDKSSGHREQQVDIYFRFRVAEASVVCQRARKNKSEQAA